MIILGLSPFALFLILFGISWVSRSTSARQTRMRHEAEDQAWARQREREASPRWRDAEIEADLREIESREFEKTNARWFPRERRVTAVDEAERLINLRFLSDRGVQHPEAQRTWLAQRYQAYGLRLPLSLKE